MLSARPIIEPGDDENGEGGGDLCHWSANGPNHKILFHVLSTKFMFCLQSLSFQMSCSLGWQEHECSQRRKIVNLSRDEKQCKEK